MLHTTSRAYHTNTTLALSSLFLRRLRQHGQQVRLFSNSLTLRQHQTMIHKILQQYAPEDHGLVSSGDYLQISPHHILTHDNTSAVMIKFKAFFEECKKPLKFANPKQPVFALDHNIQDTSEANLAKYKKIESFASENGIVFYPAGRGIGHQVMIEEGYAWPLTFTTASDSHSNMYGGIGCLGTPVVRTDAAAIWATGSTWWQVPPITRVELTGKLREGVSGKDVIIELCGLFNNDEVLNHCVEFTGDGISSLSIDERLSIANMTTEWGALAGVFPVDSQTIDWLKKTQNSNKSKAIQKLEQDHMKFIPDPDAHYVQTLTLDLSTVDPHVSGPNHVKVMQSVQEIAKKQIQVHKAYIVSCVNSRVNDLHQAANVLRRSSQKTIAKGVELYISAASDKVQKESEQLGDWQLLVQSGAKVLPPGCGPCIGLGTGLLQDGQVGISSTNRNFKGRMGSRNAEAYLASPEVVMASALKGFISLPEYFSTSGSGNQVVAKFSKKVHSESGSSSHGKTKIIEGFPEVMEGEVVFVHQDNLNTDGIYPGKYTYKETITPEEQAQVAMENYDANFVKIAKKGHVLVCGYNFGTGSSREQAATCLKYLGIQVVVGGSFSETYKRNATNNGFLCIEVPALVDYLKQTQGTNKETVLVQNAKIRIDFRNSCLTLLEGSSKKEYQFHPVGPVAQELIVLGGLEPLVIHKLSHQQ
ncbi:hypothetical protein C9374_011917 [Naegleria lovaniensis]|uniref:Homoaconitase, mitochondrial n=1 Tax=Naegleria lovaniensis TaxID=51637 RepID=A0AA88GE84_NAELO|nr:uncharacterized protein C9374_011917 [Naegleria lovaniensis]KAG2373628.1 hypothetical protein C9374_011917 [Naegleria lovaniensis]